RLPMFTRDGAAAYKKDLTNTLVLCSSLGDPQHQFRSVHIAGTNGKGSCSHALAAILQVSGYKTGLYTSPHLVDFRERIRINGQMIPEKKVIDFVESNKSTIELIQPSFFEVTVALAFEYFASEKVDIAVIETGLGGRLDSTNVVNPLLSVITNIGKDHTNMLGDTLGEIAGEKAGIIKRGVPVVISEYQEEVADVFRKKAAETGSELIFASSCLHVNAVERDMAQQTIEVGAKDIRDTITYELDLLGTYQSKNLLGVLAAVDQLRSLGWSLPQDSVQAALSKVRKLTGLRGRWEVLGHSPLLVCDTGHNADGWKEVMQNINRTPHHNLHLVLGVMADKDLDEMLPVLPLEAKYYFCQVDLPRAMPARELAQKAEAYGLLGQYYDNVLAATAEALKMADSQDLIFVGGSTFIVGDLLANRI
ncbi:MAG TPA: folylpolyglutamate synthase/dihydrofolate synthase family protein, partial [Sphingobacteriaceae bacterium]|nr:folylpolyglutamate synthase/dihydrofolate synthase family protein [Sphingobacteriaceae bacterium]